MQGRTDLALEAAEQPVRLKSLTNEDIERERVERGSAVLTRIRILSERGEKSLGKPRGTYITVEIPALTDHESELEETARLIGEQIAALLPRKGTVLVVGLGNEAITPDALGPQAAKMVLATRHREWRDGRGGHRGDQSGRRGSHRRPCGSKPFAAGLYGTTQ